MNIFVVDDDPIVVNLLSTILASDGFQNVRCFLSATKGLSALKRDHPPFDCLILDIDMPDMNGIELCRQARELHNYRDVPIIMLTGLRDKATVQAAVEAGATDYITKPFDVLQIGVRIRMSARLVTAQHALRDMRNDLRDFERHPPSATSSVTRDEMMKLFSDELYRSKKA
jgi:DNA-binding response OmpR family regulator